MFRIQRPGRQSAEYQLTPRRIPTLPPACVVSNAEREKARFRNREAGTAEFCRAYAILARQQEVTSRWCTSEWREGARLRGWIVPKRIRT